MDKLWKPEAKNTDIFSAELFTRNIKFYLKITELTVLDKNYTVYIYWLQPWWSVHLSSKLGMKKSTKKKVCRSLMGCNHSLNNGKG